MKRNDSLAPFLLIVPLVIGASFAAGYFFFGGRPAPALEPTPAPVTVPVDTPPKPAPVHPRKVASAGQYIAPGSPRISISEVKGDAPVKLPPPVVDPESSETGLPVPAAAPPVVTTDPTPPTPDTTPAATPPDGATGVAATPPATDAGTPGDATTTPPATSGTTPAAGPATGSDAPAPSTALFRVQAGTFQDEKNAKTFADALRRRGYTAIAQPSSDAANPSYRVQVGVYRNRAAADQAAMDLQRSGYPAFVSPK